MDEAQIKALISTEITSAFANADLFTPISDQLTQDVRTYLEQATAPLTERLDAIENTVTTPDPEPEDKPDAPADDSPVAKRMAALEAQVAEEKQQREAAEQQQETMARNGAVSKALQSHSPLFPDTVESVFSQNIGDLTREGDGWLTKDGKTLSEAADGFFASDVGKHFLAPNKAEGTGANKPGDGETPVAKTPIEDVLLGAFI